MEGKTPKFTRRVRKTFFSGSGWENTGFDNAEIAYAILKETLQPLGIDIKNSFILEVGSGNGLLLDLLKEKGIKAVGVDVDHRGGNKTPRVLSRVERLPFLNEAFDVVISSGNVFDSIQYDQDQNLMMREISRVLKPGGVYIGAIQEDIEGGAQGLKKISDKRSSVQVYRKV